MSKWYEKLSKKKRKLVKEVHEVVHLVEHKGYVCGKGYEDNHNNYAVKCYYTLFGKRISPEYLLRVHYNEPGWGLSWVKWPEGEDVPHGGYTCYEEQCVKALERWHQIEADRVIWQEKQKKKMKDRGTTVSKYER